MATKAKTNRRKVGNAYETVSSNIQKITRPSGTTSYRVRVKQDGVMFSEYATSLKAAKAIRNELFA